MKFAGSVGPYDVFEVLGRGAKGTAWREKHCILGKEVALKIVGQGEISGSISLLAFDRELQAIAAVNRSGLRLRTSSSR
jgi:hypothetical protein